MPEYSSIEESDVGSESDQDENVGDRTQGATLVAYEAGNDGPQVKQQEVQIGAEKVTGSDRVKRKLELAAIESERPGLFKSIHPVSPRLQLLFLPPRPHVAYSSLGDVPCRFRFLCQAWSNANLIRLAEKIRSPLVFAHVRASTMPGARESDVVPMDKAMTHGAYAGFALCSRSSQYSQ